MAMMAGWADLEVVQDPPDPGVPLHQEGNAAPYLQHHGIHVAWAEGRVVGVPG